MNPKLIGAVQLGGAVLAVILGFFDLTFFALLLLAIALLITGLDKFTVSESAPAAPARPAYSARPAYPPRAPTYRR